MPRRSCRAEDSPLARAAAHSAMLQERWTVRENSAQPVLSNYSKIQKEQMHNTVPEAK